MLLTGAGMAQWLERLPPPSVAWVRIVHGPGVIRGVSCLLVLALPRGLFPGFPSSTKINTSKF